MNQKQGPASPFSFQLEAANRDFPIVGIGAPSGGLEALEELFQAMPPNTGMAFVVVIRRHPDPAPVLEPLARKTEMPISEASDGIRVEPNHIYVGPAGGQLTIIDGTLYRIESGNETPKRPIDHFFRSLAEDQSERAICIILSGTGADGWLGLEAIKNGSGVAIIEEPPAAMHPGVRSGAMDTGLADYVLPPAEMPKHLETLKKLNEKLRERIAAQTKDLQKAKEELRAILDSTIDAIITIDRKGTIVTMNLATERIFGFAREELLGQNVKVLMPSPYREEHDSYIARYLETGEARILGVNREFLGRRKEGSTFPIDLAVSRVDHLGFFTGIIRDITEKKRTEERLRREYELNDNMIRTAQSIVLVLDTKGRIVQFNPYMEELSGWRLNEVVGRDWFETFLPKGDQRRLRARFRDAIRGNRARGTVNSILTRSGKLREIEWFDAPLTSDDGQLVGILWTGQDITERRLLERQLLRISSDEQRRIGQELHDSTQQQLTGLSLLAESLSESFARLKEQQGSDSEFHEGIDLACFHEKAKRLSEGLSETLRDVRLLSRGLIPFEVESHGLGEALTRLAQKINDVRPGLCSFSSGKVPDVADGATATHLYRIAQEATNNAVKHSKADRIAISLYETDGFILLRVSDNGIGLTRSRDGAETGIGGRIMRHRAELLGGTLNVAAGSDGGTEVWCMVPLNRYPVGECQP